MLKWLSSKRLPYGFVVPVSIVCSAKGVRPTSWSPVERIVRYCVSNSRTFLRCSLVRSGGSPSTIFLMTSSCAGETVSSTRIRLTRLRDDVGIVTVSAVKTFPNDVPYRRTTSRVRVLSTCTCSMVIAIGSNIRPLYTCSRVDTG